MVAPATVNEAGTLVMVAYHIPMVEAAPPDSDPITICVHVLLSPEDEGGVSVALAVSDHAVTTHWSPMDSPVGIVTVPDVDDVEVRRDFAIG